MVSGRLNCSGLEIIAVPLVAGEFPTPLIGRRGDPQIIRPTDGYHKVTGAGLE